MSGVFVLGVAAHPWGKFPDLTQRDLAVRTLSAALADARLPAARLQGLVAASSRFEGGLGWGLHANEILQTVCESGAAAVNVGGGCAAGAIAVHTAATMIASGQADIVAAVGAERMPKGFIPRPPGAADDATDTDFIRWVAVGATNPAYWALEARRRMTEVGTTEETLAQAVVAMRTNALDNPLARFRSSCHVGDVLDSPMVSDPLHLLQICAVSDGAAAVILGSEEQARALGVPLVQVAGSAVATGSFGDPAARIPTISANPVPGTQHTSEVGNAVTRAREVAGISAHDVDILEMADNSAWHVLAWPETLGFMDVGQADWLLAQDRLARGGPVAINPSGGFLSFGEATTAQGVLQVCELVWQLRGQAGDRQVPGARIGQTAVLGLGANGSSVVLKA